METNRWGVTIEIEPRSCLVLPLLAVTVADESFMLSLGWLFISVHFHFAI